jgi:DNA-binding MarR family transcriptional regulator
VLARSYAGRINGRVVRLEEIERSENGGEKRGHLRENGFTLRQRILLHLAENVCLRVEKTLPRDFCREGMAEALAAAQSQVSRATRQLIAEGLVQKKRCYVHETGKFRNFYYLTREGLEAANALRQMQKV